MLLFNWFSIGKCSLVQRLNVMKLNILIKKWNRLFFLVLVLKVSLNYKAKIRFAAAVIIAILFFS